ncbi:hypothetical protein [Bacillus sp. X1(2014)]|uniref:hypothetical protein n=1 Tax=Bacillus sp. X1(2014) TaxID=1565991 RepID=UPI0011AAD91A|nr:hypothetical protein [Bacillus sp. X1(2014)]
MLVTGKTEHLKQYSKGTYNKEKFIEEAKDRWCFNDNQIRMLYLVADLAENASGVFSVSYLKFLDMFKVRFNMVVSDKTVQRFFKLLAKLEVLSINAAIRKNNQQSANIYIVEVFESDVQPSVQPDVHPNVIPFVTPPVKENIAFKNTFKDTFKNTFNDKFVNKEGNNQEIIDNLVFEYMNKGLSKQVCLLAVKEVQATSTVKNLAAYLRTCLENTLYRSKLKRGEIEFPKYEDGKVPFYDWLSN